MKITSRAFNLSDPRFPRESTLRGYELMQQMLRLHSPYGLVREMSMVQVGKVLEGRLAPMDVDVYLDFASHGARLTGGVWARLGPGGKGRTPSHAIMSALGETVERLIPVFTQQIREADIRYETPRTLREAGVPIPPIELLAPLHPRQFDELLDLDPITDDSEFGWIPATTLIHKRPTMVPAQQVCFRYRLRQQDPSFVASTSVGLAAGTTPENAVLGAINELVERDAIGLSWHSNLPIQRVPLDQIDLGPQAAAVVEMLQRNYPDIVVLRHLTDLDEFTVISVHRMAGANLPCAFSAGSCASVDPAKAFLGAAIEFFQSENSALITRQLGHWQTDADEASFNPDQMERDAIETVNDRMTYYGVPQNYERVRPRLEPDATCSLVQSPPTEESELARVLGCFERRGIDPIVYHYGTAPLFADGGIHTARVMIPELTLPHVPPYRFLGHPRYYSARRSLGLSSDLDTFDTLCHEENPFP